MHGHEDEHYAFLDYTLAFQTLSQSLSAYTFFTYLSSFNSFTMSVLSDASCLLHKFGGNRALSLKPKVCSRGGQDKIAWRFKDYES